MSRRLTVILPLPAGRADAGDRLLAATGGLDEGLGHGFSYGARPVRRAQVER